MGPARCGLEQPPAAICGWSGGGASSRTAVTGPTRPAEYAFMHVLDVNGDGRNDIVTTMAHSYGVLWFEQQAGGGWTPHVIDLTWANAHSTVMADLNGGGQLDLIAAKRYWGRNGTDPAEREPMGIYWYEFRPGLKDTLEWIRHIVDYGGRAGGGLQMAVVGAASVTLLATSAGSTAKPPSKSADTGTVTASAIARKYPSAWSSAR